MRLLPFLLALAACASPTPATDAPPQGAPEAEPIDEAAFDAAAWIADVRAATTDAERIALSGRLLDAVDWRTACGEDDPTSPRRGYVQLHDVSAHQTLAEITCHAGATQSTFALVDAGAGRPPRLVRAFGIGEEGRPTADTTASFFGIPSTSGEPPGAFEVLTKSAAHGGCGLDVHYRLRPDGGARITSVRAYEDCDAPVPPAEWPVTYRQEP